MAISLYDISVSNYIQVLGSVTGILEKGAAFASDKNLDLEDIVNTRRRPDRR